MNLIGKPTERKTKNLGYDTLVVSLNELKTISDLNKSREYLLEMLSCMNSLRNYKKLKEQALKARDIMSILYIAYNIQLSSEGLSTFSSNWAKRKR